MSLRDWDLVTFSTDAPSELLNLIQRFRGVVSTSDATGSELAYATNLGQPFSRYRAAIVFDTKDNLKSSLADLRYADAAFAERPPVTFVFTGQSSAHFGVARKLHESQPVFRKTFDRLLAMFGEFLEISHVEDDLLGRSRPGIQTTSPYPLVQLFVLQFSLYQVWLDWGVNPSSVLSHSDGEYCASVVSGALALETAVRIIALRETLLDRTPVLGAMYALRMSSDDFESYLTEFREEGTREEQEEEGEARSENVTLFDIACYNSPEQLVISGDADALEKFDVFLGERDVKTYKLVGLLCPFHSKMVFGVSRELVEILEDKKTLPESNFGSFGDFFRAPLIPWSSSVVGRLIEWKSDLGPAFFGNQMYQPADFVSAVRAWRAKDPTPPFQSLALEIGPDAILTRLGPRCLEKEESDDGVIWLASLRKGVPTWESVLGCLQEIYVRSGVDIRWESFYQGDCYRPLCEGEKSLSSEFSFTTPKRRDYEPIAIIGVSCRLPDGINRTEDLFDRLMTRSDAITEVPDGRWDPEVYQRSDIKPPNRGGYVRDPFVFDYRFFNLPLAEAATMDPQHRILMELAWQALERASIPPSSLRRIEKRNRVGIVMGLTLTDYSTLLRGVGKESPWAITGNTFSAAAGRLAMFLGTEGPTLTLDSACSSSLTAIHVGIQYLHSGECDLVIVGAGNLVLSPWMNIGLTRARMLSPDAKCKVFDAGANGYARSDGFGVVVLKRFSEAKQNSDVILGKILATRVSQAGSRPLITAPRSGGQAQLMREVLATSGVAPDDIDYLEAHGTGTPLGDPTELRAVRAAFRHLRSPDCPLEIRSAKASMGHAETAAGMIGLFTVLEAFRQEAIPPQVNFEKLNPRIDLKSIPGSILTRPKSWRRVKRRVAMVNSFGFTGIDASMVLMSEELDAEASETPSEESERNRAQHLVTISAQTSKSLERLLVEFAEGLEKETFVGDVGDLAYTSSVGRDHFPFRASVVAESREELLARLTDSESSVVQGTSPHSETKLTFMFTGQGAQYVHMSESLYLTHPVFRDALDRCSASLEKHLGMDIRSFMFTTDPDLVAEIEKTKLSQPCIFALEYALSILWRSWGVFPDFILGHSIGEFAAAVFAGVLTLDDAARLIAARATLMQQLPSNGAMFAVSCGAHSLPSLLGLVEKEQRGDRRFGIAALNGPTQVVLTGEAESLASFVGDLGSQYRITRLRVSHAFHSDLMNPIVEDFRKIAMEIEYQKPKIVFISTVTGKPVTLFGADYWCNHILSSVKFSPALEEVVDTLESRVFVEIGPHPVLTRLAAGCYPEDDRFVWLHSLRRNQDDWRTILTNLARLYVSGWTIDWVEFYRSEGHPRQKCRLPAYPFHRRLCAVPEICAGQVTDPTMHPILGVQVVSPALSQVSIFSSFVSLEWPVFLKDHKIHDTTVVAGAGYVSAVLSASKRLFPDKLSEIRDVVFANPITLLTYHRIRVQTIIRTTSEDSLREFEVVSHQPDEHNPEVKNWHTHCRGKIFLTDRHEFEAPGSFRIASVKRRCTKEIDGEEVYALADDLHLQLGRGFRWIQKLFVGLNEVLGYLRLPGEDLSSDLGDFPSEYETDGFVLHPGMIDSCFQTCLGLMFQESVVFDRKLSIPTAIGEFSYDDRGGYPVWAHFQLPEDAKPEKGTIQVNIALYNETGDQLGQITELTLREVSQDLLLRIVRRDAIINRMFYRLKWRQQDLEKPSDGGLVKNAFLVFANDTLFSRTFVSRCGGSSGQRTSNVVRVLAGEQYHSHSLSEYQVNPSREQDFQRLFASFGTRKLKGVVFLWTVTDDDDSSAALSMDSIDYVKNVLIRSLFNLCRSLVSAKLPNYPRLWVVTKDCHLLPDEGVFVESKNMRKIGVEFSPISGFLKTTALEHPELRSTQIDFSWTIPVDQRLNWLFSEIKQNSQELQIMYRRDLHTDEVMRYVPRLRRFFVAGPKKMALQFPKDDVPYFLAKPASGDSGPGQIAKLTLQPLEEVIELKDTPLKPNYILVEAKACGLNFRDVLNLMNLYPDRSAPLGSDFAGIVSAIGSEVTRVEVGDSVVGASIECPSFASHLVCPELSVLKIFPGFSVEEAGGTPTVLMTAYWCLIQIAKLGPTDTVLIHSAAGGVGLAAVQVGKYVGATILATAGTKKKREYLRGLGIPCVMDSRDFNDYGTKVMEFTEGRGVDVILNSLTRDGFVRKNLDVCAHGARFVEVSKRNIWVEDAVKDVRHDVTYTVFALDKMDESQVHQIFTDCIGFLEEGEFAPLPYVVYPIENSIETFRTMMQGSHIGKFVIQPTKPRCFRKEASYLVAGGLGGIGLKLSAWLVAQEIGTLILVNRSVPTVEHEVVLEELSSMGTTEVVTLQGDISKEADVIRLLTLIQEKYPPLRGVFNSAGVLRDDLLINQTWDDFETVFGPKIFGSYFLHALTLKMSISLDYFVLFSSIVSVLGSPGQSNYAAANSFLDALVDYRRQCGLPGLSCNWGAWADVGMAARTIGMQKLQQIGMRPMVPEQALMAMEHALRTNRPHVVITDCLWSSYVQAQPGLKLILEDLTGAKLNLQSSDLLKKLNSVVPSKRKKVLQSYMFSLLTSVLNEVPKDFDENTSLNRLGIDSFTWEYVRNHLYNSLERRVNISVGDLMHHPTIATLSEHLLVKLSMNQTDGDSLQLTNEYPIVLPNQWYSWFVTKVFLGKGDSIHMISSVLELDSIEVIDSESLQSRLDGLVQKYDVFSMIFRATDTGDVVVIPANDVSCIVETRRVARRKWKKELRKETIGRPFKLSKPPFLRVILFDGGRKGALLIVVTHQIILDRIALDQFLQELLTTEEANSNSEENGHKFSDYLYSYRAWIQTEDYVRQLDFWRSRISSTPLLLSMQLANNRERLQEHTMSVHQTVFPPRRLPDLTTFLASNPEVSMSEVFLAGLCLLLFQQTGARDVSIGCFHDLRSGSDTEQSMGSFENLLPLTTTIDSDLSFLDFILRIRQNLTEMSSAKHVMFWELLSQLKIRQDTCHHPLTQVAFRYQEDVDFELHQIGDVQAKRRYDLDVSVTQLDFVFNVVIGRQESEVSFFFLYNEKLFSLSSVKKLFRTYFGLIQDAISNPARLMDTFVDVPVSVSDSRLLVAGYDIDLKLLDRILRSNKSVLDLFISIVDGRIDKLAYVARAKVAVPELTVEEMLAYLENRMAEEIPQVRAKEIVEDLTVVTASLKIRQYGDVKEFLGRLQPADGTLGDRAFFGSKTQALMSLLPKSIRAKLKRGLVMAVAERLKSELKTSLVTEMVERIEELYANEFERPFTLLENDPEIAAEVFEAFNELPKVLEQLLVEWFGTIAKEMQLSIDKELIRQLQLLLVTHRVPDFMCPTKILLLDSFPKTADGDLDIDALPKPASSDGEEDEFVSRSMVDLAVSRTPGSQEESATQKTMMDFANAKVLKAFEHAYSSPTSIVEQKLMLICSNLLGKVIMPSEMLFSHDLRARFAVQLLLEVKKTFGEKLALSTLYQRPTISALARPLKGIVVEELKESDPILTIQPKGERPALFLIHPATGMAHSYLSLQPYLPDLPVYGMNNPRFNHPSNRFKSLEEMAQEYADRICSFHEGPYYLGGWSLGGNVALCCANILRKKRKVVKLVILFDSFNNSVYSVDVSTVKLRDVLFLTKILEVAGSDRSIRNELMHNLFLLGGSPCPHYDGRVVLMKAQDVARPFEVSSRDPYNGWKGFLPNMEVCSLPGNHYQLFFGDWANSTAQKILEFVESDPTAYVLQKSSIPVDSRYLLFVAAKRDLYLVSFLIEFLRMTNEGQLAHIVKAVDFRGRSALHWMALYGEGELAELLLEAGADKESRDMDGATPAKLAEVSGHDVVMETILGCDSKTIAEDSEAAALETAPQDYRLAELRDRLAVRLAERAAANPLDAAVEEEEEEGE